MVVLTCEHVDALRDSSGKNIGYYKNIESLFSREDDTTFAMGLKLLYANPSSDFAVLQPYFLNQKDKQYNNGGVGNLSVTLHQCRYTKDLKEGTQVIYLGYPRHMGIGDINYPLARTGIISQLVKGKDEFVIDGFVQGGQSGGPVFGAIFNEEKKDWDGIFLIGLTKSYPYRLNDLVNEVKYKKVKNYGTRENMGFSNVVAMYSIVPILKQIFNNMQ